MPTRRSVPPSPPRRSGGTTRSSRSVDRVIDAGDVHLADLGGETRHPVMVVSGRRFHQIAERALVCPAVEVVVDEPFPWWIESDLGTFALDRLTSLPLDRLLDRRGHVGATTVERARRALRAIT